MVVANYPFGSHPSRKSKCVFAAEVVLRSSPMFNPTFWILPRTVWMYFLAVYILAVIEGDVNQR